MLTKQWKTIEQGTIAPIYLIVGTEQYIINETVSRIEKALFSKGEIDKLSFDLDSVSLNEVIEESNTIPFFTDKKLIIAKNSSFLKATDKQKESVKHDVDTFLEWLNHPSDTSVTVFIAPYEKVDERKKVAKKLKEHAVVIEAVSLQANDLQVWVKQQLSSVQKNIEDDALHFLVETVGNDMLQLQTELTKMVTYVGDAGVIKKTVVENLISRTLEQDIFQLTNAYFSHQKEKALQIYHDLLRQKQEPIAINALLASQVRLQLNVIYLQKKGYPVTQIANQLKVHPYRVKMIVESKQRLSEESLLRALYELANNDMQLKSTSLRRDRIVELFLMK